MAMRTRLRRWLRKAASEQAAPLLLITGRGQGKVLAADLRARGFRVIHRAVYEVVPVTALPQSAYDALAAGEVSAALFFSAESARQCVRLMQTACLQEAARTVDALAIGRPAVVALQDAPMASHPRRLSADPGCHAGAAAMTESAALPPPETPVEPAPETPPSQPPDAAPPATHDCAALAVRRRISDPGSGTVLGLAAPRQPAGCDRASRCAADCLA